MKKSWINAVGESAPDVYANKSKEVRNLKNKESPVVIARGEYECKTRNGTVVVHAPSDIRLKDIIAAFTELAMERRGDEAKRNAPATA